MPGETREILVKIHVQGDQGQWCGTWIDEETYNWCPALDDDGDTCLLFGDLKRHENSNTLRHPLCLEAEKKARERDVG